MQLLNKPLTHPEQDRITKLRWGVGEYPPRAEVSKVKALSQISPLPVLMKSYWTPATPSYLGVVYDHMFEVVFTLPGRVEELRQGL